jgi:hypothetical protein
MKEDEKSNQSRLQVASALAQVAELARELSRPENSDVDNAIGRYLLEVIEPVMPEQSSEHSSRQPRTVMLMPRLRRLFGIRQITDDKTPITAAPTELPVGKATAFDLVLTDDDEQASAAACDAGEQGTNISFH